MSDDSLLPFHFPAIQRKKVVAAFDGGRITSDGGVMLLAGVERQIGIAKTLAALIPDPRFQPMVTHSFEDMVRARMLAIACGYEDGDDLDHLRTDPGFKLACGRLPDSGADLCSQPTVSRLENAPGLRDVIRMTYALATSIAPAMQGRRARSRWISTTPAILCMATSNSPCSTRIMTSAAFCQSTSMTPRPAGR